MRDLAPDTETEIEFGDLTLHLCWELDWSSETTDAGRIEWTPTAYLMSGYFYIELRGKSVALTKHQIETLLGDRLDAEARAVEDQALEDGR